MTEILITLFGWAGTFIGLYAYYSVSTNKMDGTSLQFQLLNIISALMIFFNSAYYGALPSATLNFAWMAIGLLSISQFRKVKQSNR